MSSRILSTSLEDEGSSLAVYSDNLNLSFHSIRGEAVESGQRPGVHSWWSGECLRRQVLIQKAQG